MRTQVGIVGAGPAGLMLSHLLHLEGIDSVVLEARSREYVEQRVRAGVIEHGAAQLLVEAGVGGRMRAEGLVHHGIELRFDRARHRVPMSELAGGRTITVYGQQEVVKDLTDARLAAGGAVLFEHEVSAIQAIDSDRPRIRFVSATGEDVLECDVVAGCDGFHGVSRGTIPASVLRAFEHVYPFGWLGVLAAVAPSTEELIYCRHERGFAMHSMRSPEVSRLYLQVAPDESIDAWSDDRIWSELRTRFVTDDGWTLADGPVLEKSITAMRAFVAEPMQHGRLFLAGDAAHIVPPTGAKGMNLALADVRTLFAALREYYATGATAGLEGYSAACLRRVWAAQDFSRYMTLMLHPVADDPFANRVEHARLETVVRSPGAARNLAESYVDLTSM